MNASKISASKSNAAALSNQLRMVRSQIATANPAVQAQLVARAARLQKVLNVAAAR